MSKEVKNELPNDLPQIDPSQFELVNVDTDTKIHDQKLETKATTFAKDALKRFAKNKSSVVGATIIGLLLLGSFASIFSPHDIKTANADETLLPPKLFKTGTGWWDGTLEYHGVAYDEENNAPFGVNKDFCYDVKVDGEQFCNEYFVRAKGGYFVVEFIRVCTEEKYQKYYTVWAGNYHGFAATKEENLKVNIEMGDFPTYLEDELCAEYKVELRVGTLSDDDNPTYLLRDWSNEFSSFEINVSAAMAEHGLDSVDDGHILITGKPKISQDKLSFFAFKSVVFSTDDTNEEHVNFLNEISVTDANKTAGYNADNLRQFPTGYWENTGTRGVYQARYVTCSYRFDEYSKKLGDRENFVIGESIMQKYIDNGWCVFPDWHDPSSFKVLDEKNCPVKSVTGIVSSPDNGNPWQWNTVTTYYKYKGYKSMPSYLFGTDGYGHDLLTVAFSSLKTSLLVAIISSAACLIIGLVWGAISGYFGGNVDIIMERITDILGGVPWIIMMTLIILLLGNNVVTFGIALVMTGWISTAYRTRTQFYRFKGREYVLASRTLGASDARLIFRHILPNGSGTIVTGSVLMIPGCIFSEASISYLGLGLKGVNSFGVLLSKNQMYLSSRPMLVIIPAIIISLLMISFNLFGNGLRDALNPTLKGGEQ